MKLRILAYKIESESAKLLAQSLNAIRIRPDGNYVYKKGDIIINLGFSSAPKWDSDDVIWVNKPEAVALAVCKKKTFLKLKEHKVAIPEFTEDRKIAIGWLKEGNKSRVACRTILNGHSAQGLTVAHNEAEMPQATKLYVKYFPKKHEYRVHLIRAKNGMQIFDFIQKKVKSDIPEDQINYEIRNHGQWIFARENVKIPECVKKECIKAANALGLDLCSVDVCYQTNNDSCVVLEANSCSSLSGETTLKNYTTVIKQVLSNENVNVAVPEIEVKKKDLPPEPKQENQKIVAPQPVEEMPKAKEEVIKIVLPAKPFNPPPAAPVQIKHPIPVAPAKGLEDKSVKYSFEGLTNIQLLKDGDTIKVYGTAAGIPKPIKALELTNGNVSFWFQD